VLSGAAKLDGLFIGLGLLTMYYTVLWWRVRSMLSAHAFPVRLLTTAEWKRRMGVAKRRTTLPLVVIGCREKMFQYLDLIYSCAEEKVQSGYNRGV